MAAYIIMQILGIAVSVAFIIMICVFKALTQFMPYVTGLMAGAIVYFSQVWAQRLIPGHPVMCFITVLAVIEAAVFILVHLPEVGKAFTVALSSLVVVLVGGLVLTSLKPDSIGYCAFATVVYFAVMAFFIWTNIGRYELCEDGYPDGAVSKVISIVIYAASAVIMIWMPVEVLWIKYLTAL